MPRTPVSCSRLQSIEVAKNATCNYMIVQYTIHEKNVLKLDETRCTGSFVAAEDGLFLVVAPVKSVAKHGQRRGTLQV